MALEWTEQDGAFLDGVFGDSPAPEGLVMAWENDELSKPPPSDDGVSPSNVNTESSDVKEASETLIASATKLSTGLSTTKANDNDVLCVRGDISFFIHCFILIVLPFDSRAISFPLLSTLKAPAMVLIQETNTFES